MKCPLGNPLRAKSFENPTLGAAFCEVKLAAYQQEDVGSLRAADVILGRADLLPRQAARKWPGKRERAHSANDQANNGQQDALHTFEPDRADSGDRKSVERNGERQKQKHGKDASGSSTHGAIVRLQPDKNLTTTISSTIDCVPFVALAK